MRKNKVLKLFIALLLLAVAVFFIAGTYSRYSTTGNGNAKVDVAKWAVTIKNGDKDLVSSTQNINFVVADNDYVVSNKIAPATKATADIDVDFTGTEVATDIIATLGTTSNVPDGAVLTITVDGNDYDYTVAGNKATFALPSGAAFDSTNGVKRVTLTLTWENSDTAARIASDTAAGEAAKTVEVPITITAQQHITTTP